MIEGAAAQPATWPAVKVVGRQGMGNLTRCCALANVLLSSVDGQGGNGKRLLECRRVGMNTARLLHSDR